MGSRNTILISAKTRSFLLGLIIILAGISLFLGIILPVLKLTKLYVWSDVHSIASVILALFQSGEFFLAAILAIFSILFPALKLLYLLALYATSPPATSPTPKLSESELEKQRIASVKRRKSIKRLAWLGKWSMLDVMVLSLMIFYVKSTDIADASSLPGIYFFTASVLLSMIAVAALDDGAEK